MYWIPEYVDSNCCWKQNELNFALRHLFSICTEFKRWNIHAYCATKKYQLNSVSMITVLLFIKIAFQTSLCEDNTRSYPHAHTHETCCCCCCVCFFLHVKIAQMGMATIAADTAHCREFKAQLLSLKGIISVQFIAFCRQFIFIFAPSSSCLFVYLLLVVVFPKCSTLVPDFVWTCWKTTCNLASFSTLSIWHFLWRYFHFGMCCPSQLFYTRFFFLFLINKNIFIHFCFGTKFSIHTLLTHIVIE